MSDTIKIDFWINTGFAGTSHNDSLEVDRKTWESMSQAEKDNFMGDQINVLIDNCIEGGWKVAE